MRVMFVMILTQGQMLLFRIFIASFEWKDRFPWSLDIAKIQTTMGYNFSFFKFFKGENIAYRKSIRSLKEN